MKKNTIAKHNISILFWVQFFSTMSFLQPVITLFYMERGLSEKDILVVLMFWSVAVMLGEVPSGIFADRFGAKKSFLAGALINIISYSLLFFAHSPGLFFLYSALNGLSVTFFSGADEALIYESLKESDEQHLMDRAMGKIQSAGFISAMIAVLFGAYIAKDLKEGQFQLLIALGLVFYSVQLILLFWIKNPSSFTPYRENPFKQVTEGLKVIKEAPQLLYMFLNVTLVFIPASAVYENFNQPLFTHAGLPVYLIGIVYAVAAIIGYFASHSVGWLCDRFSRVLLMNITGILAVVGLLLSAMYGETLWLVLGAFFVLKFVRAIRYPIYSQLSNDIIPSEVRATTISLLSILDSICDLVVFGIISAVALKGISSIFVGCAILALIGTLLPIKMVKTRVKLENN
ncbi:MFS transporter [Bacillus sp. FJAT-49736]|uniref:MFS transporter n=1 Tax=Bacillus sp. FJAT-49736 TaxID=2833582 RepID=UPI001BCA61C8|nr:MFS transporter [Bacillus sp. FJAT-49736]MBS4175622.1 MFS transporter [Bacillus sp. FJAT-49736]